MTSLTFGSEIHFPAVKFTITNLFVVHKIHITPA
ncbi:hypothetical protein VCC_001193 [Vibrio cholerae RC9]|nr:hypothetical protein VCD_000938 [Vibrio cholerae MJ-1236]EEO10181.1 hypothetical protein VCC_001193 [Vibrio cholerae RC9]